MDINAGQHDRHRSFLRTVTDQIFSNEAWSDAAASVVKTAPLFVPGVGGLVGTMATNALDAASPQDSAGTIALDLGLGATKGALLRGAFSLTGSMPGGIASRAFALGVMSRGLETGFDRHTYLTANGDFSLSSGLTNVIRTTFNPISIGTDIASFGIAAGATNSVNYLTRGLLERSPFLGTIATGAIYGMTYGSSGEAQRQYSSGEGFNFAKIVAAGAREATTSGIAAIPGGLIAQRNYNALRDQNFREWQEANKKREEQLKIEPTSTKKEGPISLNGIALEDGRGMSLGMKEMSSTDLRATGDGATLRVGTDQNVKVNGSAVRPGTDVKVTAGDTVQVESYSAWLERNHTQTFKLTSDNGKLSVQNFFDGKPSGKPVALSPYTPMDFGAAEWQPAGVSMKNGEMTLNAGNGLNVTVNGKRVADGASVPVQYGDKVEYDNYSGWTERTTRQTVNWSHAQDVVGKQPVAWVVDKGGDKMNLTSYGEVSPVRGGEVRVGADKGGIYLAPAYDKPGFFDTTNITFNGKQVRLSDKAYVAPTDAVSVGGPKLQFGISWTPTWRRIGGADPFTR